MRIVVAHYGKQHSYRLAAALKQKGYLSKYITTVYLKKNNWTRMAQLILKGNNLKRVESRKLNVLDDTEVIQFNEIGGLLKLLLLRVDKSRKVYIWWSKLTAKLFEKKVAKYVTKNNPDALIMYDTNASTCFEILQRKAPQVIRILDVSSATHNYMREIYKEDIKKCGKFSKSLVKSSDYFWKDKDIEYYMKEIKYAQYFLTPSSYVKMTLEDSGVNSENIYVTPYGVDIKLFSSNRENEKLDKLNFVYVGEVNQRKGIFYLLEAFKKYDNTKVNLTLVGNYDNTTGLFDEYIKLYNFTGHVTHDKVAEILSESHAMVFPSLSDAFGLVVLEALGAGVPVICTCNTGASDLIEDGYNGFVIPIGDKKSIQEKVDWFIDNKEKIKTMSKNAYDTAKKYTWEKYNNGIIDSIDKIRKKRII